MSTFTKTMEKGLHNFLEFLPCSWYRGAALYVTCTIKKENYGHPYGMYEYDIQVPYVSKCQVWQTIYRYPNMFDTFQNVL